MPSFRTMRLKSPISTSSTFLLSAIAATATGLLYAEPVAAHEEPDQSLPLEQPQQQSFGNWAAGVGISSLGGELQLRYQMVDQLALRAVAAGGAVNFTTFQDGFAYEYEVELGSAGAMIDWHPFSNGFRLTAGGRYNANRVDVLIRPGRDEDVPSTILDPINDLAIGLFSPAEVTGEVAFFELAPYLGIGYFGEIWGRFWLSIDAGIYYQGDPEVTLEQGTIDLFTQDQTDLLASQEEQAERDLRLLAYLPMVSLSLSYRF